MKLKKKTKIGKINEMRKKRQMMEHYMTKGLSVKEASVLSNVSKKELMEMRSNTSFEDFLQKCEATHELDHLENINRAGRSGAWQASAFMLERKYPDRYGKKDIVKHEYEVKFLTFQKIILEVINEVDPQLKHKIMKKLRGVNTDELRLMEHKKENIMDAEMVEI